MESFTFAEIFLPKLMKRNLLLFALIFTVTYSQAQRKAKDDSFEVIQCSEFHLTKPLAELAKEFPIPSGKLEKEEMEDRKTRNPRKFVKSVKDGPEYGNDSASMQTTMGDRPGKAPLQNWLGQQGDGYPPDPSGAAGPNHYVQCVNATYYKVYNKTGTALLTGTVGSLWNSNTNDGDPIVMYDKYADRWFISQFGQTGNRIYIAISQTSNPTGAYYTYTFTAPNSDFPDYLKFSIWENGYYMNANFGTQRVLCFERDKMLLGNSGARMISKTFNAGSTGSFYTPLPADADITLPAAGTPLPFFAYSDNAWGGGEVDAVKVWNMTVTWGTTPVATITTPTVVTTAAFDASYNSSWNDVPQPGIGQKLDGIGGVLNYRAQWTKWTGYNSVVLNWAVKISSSQRSIKWVELRQNQTTGVWSLYQEGTYTPDTYTRWVGSIAMDANGSIALCYAKSGASTVYPSLGYTGRLASDPLGTFSIAETIAIAGAGSQNGVNRFGDYSQTSIDPDGVTFWHTGEYIGSGGNLQTRVYSFQIPIPTVAASVAIAQTSGTNPTCAGNSVTFTATPTNGGTTPTYVWKVNGATVGTNSPTFTTTTLTSGQTVTCIMTSSLSSVTGSPSTSNAVTMTIIAIPITPTLNSNTPICAGSTINLSTPTVSGATYAWTGPSSFTSASQNPSRNNATTAMAGTYSLTTTVNGCTSLAGTTTIAVNAIPSTPTASSNTPVCAGTSINLITPTVANATYAWTGPNSFSNSSQNPSLSNSTTAMAGTYSLTKTVNGCTSLAGTTTVVVNPIPTTPSPASNSPICTGSVLSLTTPTVSGASYAWTGPNSFTSTSQNPTLNSATIAMSGSYNLTETFNGCTSLAGTVVVAVNSSLSAPTVSSNSPVCTNGTISLTTPTVAGASYAWSGPNGFTSMLQNPQLSGASTAMNGTYSLTITSGTCTSVAGTTSVLVNNSLTTPSPNSNSPVCVSGSINLTTPTVAGATYAWAGPNGFTSNLQNPTISNATALMGGTYSVVVSSGTCVSSPGTTALVVSNSSLSTPVANSNSPVCTGNSINLTTASVSGATYTWTGPNSFTSTSQNPTIPNATSAMNGQYSVVVSANGCVSSDGNTTLLTLNSVTPSIAVSSNPVGTICQNDNVSFVATPSNGGGSPIYQWLVNNNPGGSQFTFSSSTLNNGDVVKCILTSSATCATPTTVSSNIITMTVSPIPATPTISMNGSDLVSSSPTGNQWYIGGLPISGAINQTYTPLAIGDYTVLVTIANCQSTASIPYSLLTVGMSFENNPNGLSIFPNPNSGVFFISFFSNEKADFQLEVTDILGQIVHKAELKSVHGNYANQIDLSQHAVGVYTLTLKGGKAQIVKKILVNK